MKIRACKVTDLKQCEDLCNSPELLYPDGGHFSVGHLKHLLNDKYFLVTEDKIKIIGTIFGEKLNAGGSIVWVIVVANEYRGKGIGSQLLKKFEKNAKSDNCKWTVLYSATKIKKTVEFYKKHKYDIGKKYIECAKDL